MTLTACGRWVRGPRRFRVSTLTTRAPTHAILLLLVSLASPDAAVAGPEWKHAVTEALLRGNWSAVGSSSRRWKEDDPMAAPADWLSGYSSLVAGNIAGAFEALSRIDNEAKVGALAEFAMALATEHPENAVAHMLCGDAAARRGDLKAATESLDRAVRLDPRSALVLDVRGLVHGLAGRLGEAAADLRQAVELEPKLADAHANLGLVRLQEGDAPGAVGDLTQAVELAPEFALAWNGRGVAFVAMEAWEDGERDFEKAAELAPGLSLPRANLRFASWTRARANFRQSLAGDDGRGTTFLAQSYDQRAIDIGGGRSMDVFVVKATPQTGTPGGMQEVVRAITTTIRADNELPATWQPRLHVDTHGWSSTPYAQIHYAAAMGQHAGADAVITLDLSSWYKWQRAPTWSSDVTLAAGQTARAVAAIRSETGLKPSYSGNSGGAEIIPRLGEMLDRGELPATVAKDISFSRVVLTGYPFQERLGNDIAVSSALLSRIDGRIYNLHTTAGNWSNTLRPADKVVNVLVTDQGRGIAYADWTHALLRRRNNPSFEVGGAGLRGWEPHVVQQLAEQRGRVGSIPMYETSTERPVSDAFATAAQLARGLQRNEKVLVGALDSDRAQVLSRPFAGAWPTEWKRTNSAVELQTIARNDGYTRILVDRPGDIGEVSRALLRDAEQMPAATLPSLRPLAQNIDRFNQAASLVYKLADKPMPAELKLALSFSGPVLNDLGAARAGQFNPWTAHTLERVGVFGIRQLPEVASGLVKEGKLPAVYGNLTPMLAGLPDVVAAGASQIGRSQIAPTVDELTHYLDAVNKTSWAVVGGLVGGSRGASIGATGGGLAADVLRGATEPLFQQWAHQPVRRQVIEDFRAQVTAASGHGLPAKTFTDMYTTGYLREVGFNPRAIVELDNYARWANTTNMGMGGLTATRAEALQRPIPVSVVPLQDDSWKRMIGWFPPFKPGGTAAVEGPTFRLPPMELPVDKRGGVSMKTDVIKGESADTSEMFGGRTRETPKAGSHWEAKSSEGGLSSPPLLFFALLAPA